MKDDCIETIKIFHPNRVETLNSTEGEIAIRMHDDSATNFRVNHKGITRDIINARMEIIYKKDYDGYSTEE